MNDSLGSLAGNLESSGSGGSMVARLKLKGIDGRAPPGVFHITQDLLLIVSCFIYI